MALINNISIDASENFEIFSINHERDVNFSIFLPIKIQKYRIVLNYNNSFITNFEIGNIYQISCNTLFKHFIDKQAKLNKNSNIYQVVNNLGEAVKFTTINNKDFLEIQIEKEGVILYRPTFQAMLVNYSCMNNIKKMIFEEI